MKSRVGVILLLVFSVFLVLFHQNKSEQLSSEKINTWQEDSSSLKCSSQHPQDSNIKMWSFLLAEKLHGNKFRYLVESADGKRRMTQLEAFSLMANEAEGEGFRRSLCQVLASHPAAAYFWETTSTNRHVAATRPFEFIIVPAPTLESVQPEPWTFQEYFGKDCSFATFTNLGGDAMLVAPSPCEGRDYAHLARFIQNAPEAHAKELFVHVGRAVLDRLSDAPMWVSTSGAGVYWLHVRLDSRPKYYSFAEFRAPPPSTL